MPANSGVVLSDVCVSCTTDDGHYAMFDTRSDMTASAVSADSGKTDLFTHARYTDHHLLLGYGDGEMKQLDMRKAGEMSAPSSQQMSHQLFHLSRCGITH